jgi:hypothetical protein
MANDRDEPDGRNRPNTIELTATEIKSEPEADTAPASEGSAAPASENAPPPARSGSGLRIAGAVLGALVLFAVGLGAGYWLSLNAPALFGATPVTATAPAPVPVQVRTDPALLDRLAKLEAALSAPRAQDPQLLSRVVAAEAAARTAADFMTTRERRSDEIAAMAQEARDRATSAASAADEAVKKAAAVPEQPRVDLTPLNTRIATLESAIKANQAEIARSAKAATSDDARGRLAVAALALRNAAESGEPFAAELAAVKALGGEAGATKALETFAASGIPTPDALGRELSALMPQVWKAGRATESSEGGFLARLQANAEKIVRVRPAGEAGGDDAAHVKARIETRAQAANVRGALAEFAKLAPEARAPADGWIRKAQARETALAAARTLSQAALSALAKSGS